MTSRHPVVRHAQSTILQLASKQLAHILESLELKRITRRIQEKHRRLLSRFTFEAHTRLNDVTTQVTGLMA